MPRIRTKARELLDELEPTELPQSELTARPSGRGRILWGARKIAEHLFDDADQPEKVQKQNRRKVYDAAESGELPVFYINGVLCAWSGSIDHDFRLRESATRLAIQQLKTAQ